MEFEHGVTTASTSDLMNTILPRLLVTFVVTVLIFPACIHIYRDYLAFLALGPGGTPSTVQGYLRIKALGLFALKNPYAPRLRLRGHQFSRGFLEHLATRKGKRPETRGIAPQRQITQKASKRVYDRLTAAIEALPLGNDGLMVRTSCFEKHSTGLFAITPVRKTCRGEICHAHPSDGSMHLTLHPADANMVLAAGWGERHPLARGGWFERFVPGEFIMVYAPQDDDEVTVVLQIVLAAAWYVCAERAQNGVDKSNIDDQTCCGSETSTIVKLTAKPVSML